MLNFTVGPVMMDDATLQIGALQIPYFRTPEFSEIMFESESLVKELSNADRSCKALFLTGSGTASMEAAIINCFTNQDKLLIVNGGSFGQRFVEICQIHNIPYCEICKSPGKDIVAEDLESYDGKNFTGFIVNIHETSTGVLYNKSIISEFCKKNGLFLIVDAISSFLADTFDFTELGCDVMITGSQKALACAPGISILVLSERATNRINKNNSGCLYLDLKRALKDGQRGQTPFTPAVGTILQIYSRLKTIKENGGAYSEINRIKSIANDFRNKIKNLPLTIVSDSLSNALTPLSPHTKPATEIFKTLKDLHGIWICPNGGSMADKIFRVGHIGALTEKDNTILVNALTKIL